MQTFMPYPAYEETARCLDRQRLGKQRVEARQILQTLAGASSAWVNHPAVRMWRGHELSLCAYGLAVCGEWVRRGYVDNQAPVFSAYAEAQSAARSHDDPPWLVRLDVLLGYRSNLVRKLPGHYGPLWPDVPADLPYVWPV